MNYVKSPKASILIVDDVHPLLIEALQAHKLVCDYFPTITKEEALGLIGSYEGLVIRSKFRLTADVLAGASPGLRFVARAGAGMDNIDVKAADSLGVTLLNAPEGNRDAVGEHTLGMLLALAAKLVPATRQVKGMIWNRSANQGIELKGRCVGIIGYGFMGTSFAAKLGSLDCRVMAYDKYRTGFVSAAVEEVTLEQVFDEADILSLHVPLTRETKGWVNAAFLERFKKPFMFLNTSRGEIVNTADLVEALQSGRVKSAGLDVLESEKFPLDLLVNPWFETLAAMPQVILTPHVAGWTTESYLRISEVLAVKILAFYGLGPHWPTVF